MSIKDKIAVIGVGCSKFGENYNMSADDMIVEAVFEAYADAKIEPQEIQAAWVATLSSGISATTVADPLKLYNIPITRVENYCASGMDAFRNACFAVASGMYDVALVVGVEKLKDSGQRGLGAFGNHPVLAYGTTAPSLFAMAATRYMHKFGITKETLAQVAVKNHKNGCFSPKAHFQMEVTVDKVVKAPMISSPLGLFDCCPTTDGAAAAIICKKELAKKYRDDPVYVKGLGLAVTSGKPYFKPGYDYLSFEATTLAAEMAYKQVGITNPRKEISFAEVHDCFTITEILVYEDLKFCKKGEGGEFIPVATLEGDLPVNPSGGLKSFGHPIGATGVRMIYELTLQLQGRAGKRQVKNPELGLAYNLGGPGAIGIVTILGNK
jgi:acetyl-CoA C-acetyltransferase